MTERKSGWGQTPPPRRKRSPGGCTFLLWGLLTGLAVYLLGWTLLGALSLRPSSSQAATGGLGVDTEFNEHPRWEGKERVNILLIGIDQRGQEAGPWRTDTLIVLSVDPVSKSAGMLSIPRDLWVEIPGYDQNRINTAYVLGETNKYPGGGPALAKKTVQYNLGEPIHYFIQLNFTAVEQLVDVIGGVDMYVEREIDDPLYPDNAYGYDPLYIPAGWQHMDGKLALKYARSRHGSSDFDRARRQQQLLLVVRAKVARLDTLGSLLPKAGEIVSTLGNTVRSDLTLDQVVRLAQLAAEIDSGRIRSAVVDSTMTRNWTTPKGAQVLVPDRERMAVLHTLIFSPPEEQAGGEAAQILLQNGTAVPGLATQCAERLRQQGFQVANVTNAPRQDYPASLILVYTGKWTTARALAAALGLPDSALAAGSNPEGPYDIKVILADCPLQ
ncbi:MAG: LCP family protein [Thermoflexales bacterium]|nr:LCP family protein [Thermoflexales bacterium]